MVLTAPARVVTVPPSGARRCDRVSRDYRVGLLGLRKSTTFLDRATGPVAFTAAAPVSGYRPLMAVTAAGVLVVTVALSLTRATVVPGEPDPSARRTSL